MKKITTITFVFLLSVGFAFTQNNKDNTHGVSIAPWNVPPHEAAMLDVISTNKGVLYPRMTYTQMMLISPVSGADALQVYVTEPEERRGLWFYDVNHLGGTSKWVRYGVDIEKLVPMNMVIMIEGSNTCPAGWTEIGIANGRFIVGADENNPTDYYPAGKTGGLAKVTLEVVNIPKHDHEFTGTANTFSVASSSHNHPMLTRHSGSAIGKFRKSGFGRGWSREITKETDGSIPVKQNAHAHNVTGTINSTSDVGVGLNAVPHNNIPPYVALKYCTKNN